MLELGKPVVLEAGKSVVSTPASTVTVASEDLVDPVDPVN